MRPGSKFETEKTLDSKREEKVLQYAMSNVIPDDVAKVADANLRKAAGADYDKVKDYFKQLGAKYKMDDYMTLVAAIGILEGNLMPNQHNTSSNASGALQLMPNSKSDGKSAGEDEKNTHYTARKGPYAGKIFTPEKIRSMSLLEQMPLIESYFSSWYARDFRFNNMMEVHSVIHYPAGLKHLKRGNFDFVLGSEQSEKRARKVAKQNNIAGTDGKATLSDWMRRNVIHFDSKLKNYGR